MPERGGRFNNGRHAGVLVPLFSIPSRRSWGIGEIPDLVALSRWLARAGLDFVQFLPLNEMQEGQSSPYSALSAMAIDPLFIAVEDVDEFVVAGDDALAAEDREALARVRQASRVDYAVVRNLKGHALRRAFSWFAAHLWGTGDRRDRSLRAFEEREHWWLDDYGLFRALHDEHGGEHWREWEPGLRDRDRVCPRGGTRASRMADSVLLLPPVDCRRTVAARTDGGFAGGRVRRLSVHGQQPQR